MSLRDLLPPSPPTTSSRKQRMPLFQIPPTSTPDDSPASGTPSSLGSRKKVGFSPWTNILSADAAQVTEAVTVRPLPPSRECSSSGKSILKTNGQVQQPPPGSDGPGDEKLPLNETMDSILQQLSRNDTVECVDAYQTLASAIKAYDELPEQLLLKGKLQAILKAIRQHLTALDQPDPQPCDFNLVTSALKVLVILVWNTDFAPYLTDDFRLFALDRAINTVAEHKAPKSVIVHYLHLLATQDFRQGLLSSSRAVRLLDGLAHLTDHVKGNGVVSERLLVYHKLLDQVKPVMKIKAGLWVEHMISAMISTIPDTRSKAMGLGRKACQSFPASDSISGIVKAVLSDVQDDEKTKGYAMCKKLEKMTASKDAAEHVPQIWAIMILLCSSESTRIDKWPGLKDWLMVIQRCFNSSDSNLRLQANLAWNRFVYVARPQELEASETLLGMLVKPIIPQLERHSADKSSKASHNAAISSYCNLLYYAFRPATSASRLTKAWNEYIVKVMRSSFFEKNAANADLACRILMTLLWNAKTGTKVWNEKRAHETRPIDPEELPTIDAKWVRSHAANIANIFEVLFRYSSWGLPESSEQAYISRAWRHFVKSVRSASSKEIKMSSESRFAVLSILDCISRSSQDDGSEHALDEHVLHNLTSITVAELGSSYVLEALDSDKPTSSTFMALDAVLDQIKPKLQADSSPTKQNADILARCLDILDKRLIQGYANGNESSSNDNALMGVTIKALSMIPASRNGALLTKVQPGLSIWLRDEYARLQGTTLQRVGEAFAYAASKVVPEALQSCDEVFTAAFTSSHGTLVSLLTTIWNEHFADCESSQLPPQLSSAFLRLRHHVELRLPVSFVDDDAGNSALPAYHTQVGEDLHVASLELGSKSVHHRSPSKSEVAESSPVRPSEPLPTTHLDSGRPSSSGPRRRRRHDDSQVDFVAVDSSPIVTNQESQLLTDRQKEVRDRQRSEPAVVFADLRSSPRPVSRAPSEPRSDCGFARKAATMTDRPSTPIPDPADDAEVQPSPTPKSRYIRNLADIEIPSSPPSVQGAAEKTTETEQHPERSALATESNADDDDTDIEMDEDAIVEEYRQDDMIVEVTGLGARTEGNGIDEPMSDTPVEETELRNGNAAVSEQPSTTLEVKELVVEEEIVENTTIIEHDKEIVAETADEHPLRNRQDLEVVAAVQQQLAPPSTPPRASSRIDSDELELMSASQLSNDLDWSVVLDGLDRTPAFSIASVEQPRTDQSDMPPPDSQASQASQSKARGRKRKAVGAGWTRSKKSKNSTRGSSRSSESVEPSFKHEEEEILDVIEVIDHSDPATASSSPPRDTETDVFVDAPESQQQQEAVPPRKKKAGRSKKQRLTEARAASRALRSSSVLSSGHSQSERRSVYSVESSAEPEAKARKAAARVVVVDNEGTEQPEEDVMEEVDAASAPPVVSGLPTVEVVVPTRPPSTGILASLQQVLNRVKNGEAHGVDLRAIDDLCFNIRFHAQQQGSEVN